MNLIRKMNVGLIVALSIVGCSSEEFIDVDKSYPIRPTSHVVSRVVLNSGSAFDASLFRVDQVKKNIEKVYAYPANYSGISSALAVSVATGGDITFTGGEQYYDGDGAKTALLGVYPAVADGKGVWNATAGTVTYAIDGDTDIMATSFAEGDKDSEQPTLSFAHFLTQFSVKVYKEGDNALTVQSIKVVGREPACVLTLPAPGTAGDVAAAFSGDATDLSLFTDGSVSSPLTVTATIGTAAQIFGYSMFAPVDASADAITLKVDLGEDDVRIATVPKRAFEKGKRYSVVLKIDAGSETPPVVEDVQIEGTVAVSNWIDNDGEVTGEFEKEEVKTYADPSNSYILASGGTIYIPVSRANEHTAAIEAADAIGDADEFTPAFLWADAPLLLTELAADGVGKTGYIKVTASGSVSGNAVVAVKVNDEIKWSWHIWVTDYTPSGTWMDRYLGALSATSSDKQKTYGLYYQWGRKDPFPAAGAFNANTEPKIYANLSDAEGATYNVAIGRVTAAQTYAWSVANPTAFVGLAGSWFTPSTTSDNYWGQTGGKTIYDPCPEGYRVPAFSGTTSPWSTLTTSNFTWDSTNKGRTSSAHGGWYSASGHRGNASGSLTSVGTYGYVWSAYTASAANGSVLDFYGSNVYPASSNYRAYGHVVRCLSEQ